MGWSRDADADDGATRCCLGALAERLSDRLEPVLGILGDLARHSTTRAVGGHGCVQHAATAAKDDGLASARADVHADADALASGHRSQAPGVRRMHQNIHPSVYTVLDRYTVVAIECCHDQREGGP